MRNYLLLFLSFITYTVFAQYKLSYNYVNHYDSLKPNKAINEDISIIKTPKEKYYYSENFLKLIEIENIGNKNNENPQLMWKKLAEVPRSKLFNVVIIKGDIFEIFNTQIKYKTTLEYLPINWKIENITSINNLKKATTTYLGRNWIALYDESIPINDGPFLFSGLPGLIIELQDDQGYFKWKLNSYDLDYDDKNFIKELIEYKYKSIVDLNSIEFKKIINESFLNPTISIQTAGIQLDEERIKRIVENQKLQKHRFLIPEIWTYL